MLGLIAAALPLLETVIDRAVPDTAEREQVKAQIAAQAAEADNKLRLAQIDLAKEDAKSGKGGFRWGAGWLCVASLAYAWIIRDLLLWLLAIFAPEVTPPPDLPSEAQYAMLTGMLGLGGIRSFDLSKGTRR